MTDLSERLRDRATALTESPMMSAVRQTVEWEAAEELDRLREINAELLAALAGVQFAGPRFRCMECGGQPSTGHTHRCRVGAAIAKAEGTDR